MGEMAEARKVDKGSWEGPAWGRVELAKDWHESFLPPLRLPEGTRGRLILTRESAFEYAKFSGYTINGDWVSFVAPILAPNEKIFLAGEFNHWNEAVGDKTWEMHPQEIAGAMWAVLTVKRNLVEESRFFKFVNDKGVWREPPFEISNAAYKEGARNYFIDPQRTGSHLFRFEIKADHEDNTPDWRQVDHLVWQEGDSHESVPLWPGLGFYEMASKSPQGAILERGGLTTFRLFAPRATRVSVGYFPAGKPADEKRAEMEMEKDGCWAITLPKNLEDYSYFYSVEGHAHAHTGFDAAQKVLDPWALAVRDKMGVVVDRQKIWRSAPESFTPPPLEELFIAEAHVRDLLAKAPLDLTDEERKGFAGVRKYLQWKENVFSQMGVNAVELQPLMEFDGNPNDYAWGYMPINFFAPAAAYGSDRLKCSQVEEAQKMIAAFHKKGMAVILDVVFNHMGVPTSLLFVDKAYYFRLNTDGALTNWSGCGNDFRIESAMAERMVLEAMEHWVTTFGVDGFRFDLAELLGINFLKRAEAHLKEIKPGIILIAEPWSFRGHIAAALKDTSYASWNDGFREFVPGYLDGRLDAQSFKYFIRGSVGGMTVRPTQSVNYVESHDDQTWLDRITQNAGHNGYYPTLRDRRLTHLMATMVTMALGVPMWSSGMDAMRSKYGVRDTYLRGDLNTIDYGRIREFPVTVEYFRGLTLLRRGQNGKALRVREAREGYLQFFMVERASAIGVLYNAQKQESARRIFYAINPLPTAVKIKTEGLRGENFIQVADHERVNEEGLGLGKFAWNKDVLEIPPVSVGVWLEL